MVTSVNPELIRKALEAFRSTRGGYDGQGRSDPGGSEGQGGRGVTGDRLPGSVGAGGDGPSSRFSPQDQAPELGSPSPSAEAAESLAELRLRAQALRCEAEASLREAELAFDETLAKARSRTTC